MCLGRPVEELPRITSFLSPSHHLVSALALDNLVGVQPPQLAVNMRSGLLLSLYVAHHLRKLYFFLSVHEDPFREFHIRESARQEGQIPHQLVNELLQCIDLVQEAAAILGGRAHHPVSAVAGGVGRALKEPYYERLMEIAEKALAKDIKQVVFDRNGFLYHGRVKALADAAREAGLFPGVYSYSWEDEEALGLIRFQIQFNVTGEYDQIRLGLGDSWVVVAGESMDLRIPSGDASGLKIPELKRLIVSQGDAVVMASSLKDAFRLLEAQVKEKIEREKGDFPAEVSGTQLQAPHKKGTVADSG